MKRPVFGFFKKYMPVLLFIGCWAACSTPPDYPIEPVLEFVDVSKDTIRRGSFFNDTTFVTFSFTDGDGDIGDRDSLQLFVTDSRNGFVNDFRIPFVLEPGASNGIKGEITVRLFSSCCIFPSDLFLDGCTDIYDPMPYDKVVYDIYIKDRAGHQSNVISTTPIFIRCF
ncbi:MAG TPA: hypothetical protein ENJ20_05300 [Bacteroidetes bacterium]|nr:hypothetical protein [Bacteroidota bacterium]